MSMNRKKNATDAEAVGFSTEVPAMRLVYCCPGDAYQHGEVVVPLNESRIDIIIIEMNSPKEPHIIGLRRPNLSE